MKEKEKRCLEALGQAWDEWCSLPRQHPDELGEFRFYIHALQRQVGFRLVQRIHPDVFPIRSET